MKIPTSYPEHISDSIRIKIAQELTLHEFKKLFRNLSSEDMIKIKKDIQGWYEEPNEYNLSTIRDFWNGVDGLMMGFKLKSIVPLITAKNVNWDEKTISTEEAIFGVNLFNDLTKDFSTLNKSSKEVMQYLESNEEFFKRAKDKSDHCFSGVPRENDRVIAITNLKQKIKMHDGNGRLLKATIYNKLQMNAFVGTYVSSADKKVDSWIPTGYLMHLVQSWLNGQKDQASSLIMSAILNSKCAAFEFFNRAIDENNSKAVELKEIIKSNYEKIQE